MLELKSVMDYDNPLLMIIATPPILCLIYPFCQHCNPASNNSGVFSGVFLGCILHQVY